MVYKKTSQSQLCKFHKCNSSVSFIIRLFVIDILGLVCCFCVYLDLSLGQLHVVEDAENDVEELLPPLDLERVAVGLHDLEHDRQASVTIRSPY